MPRSKLRKLSSLFSPSVKAAVQSAISKHSQSPPPPPRTVTVKKIKKTSTTIKTSLRKTAPHKEFIYHSLQDHTSNPSPSPSPQGDSSKILSNEISSILTGPMYFELELEPEPEPEQEPEPEPEPEFVSEPETTDDDGTVENDSELSWFSNLFTNSTGLRRKELSRERKNKWIFKNTQKRRFDTLVGMCLDRLGSGSTFDVLHKLGRETGLKECNAFIQGCVLTARSSTDERVQMEQLLEAYRLFQLMKERGFPIEEETFGPFFMYLIDMHMAEHFLEFFEIIKDEDTSLHPRLGYYEMLFWIEMNDEEKVKELCDQIAFGESEMGSLLHENYLLALCERDRGKELLQLLDIIDISSVSSLDYLSRIFQSLGRLCLEHYAELFIQVLKNCDNGTQRVSNLIYDYVTSMKNLAVEDVYMKFKDMHGKLDIELVPKSYEKLIKFCCDSLKVHVALDLVEEMCEEGLSISTEALNSICRACEDTSEFTLVRRIHSMLLHRSLKPNSETFRSIINLHVKMKDFDNAYAMLKDLEKWNLNPTPSMYNAILAGCYREKNRSGIQKVLNEMKRADVKPDSQTFSYLIGNCTSEEEIIKYYEDLKCAGVQPTKHVFMSLVNAYASCGQFDKAKQVVLDKGVPVKYLSEIKSVLVSSLASNGQVFDALDVYEEIKRSGSSLEPKAILALIEKLQAEGELGVLLQLLEELNDRSYWIDGCCRIISYCVRNKELRHAVHLLKKLVDKFQDNELACEVIFDEVFMQLANMEEPDLKMGTDLLQAIKGDLGFCPSRKSLDFLLSACVNARDLQKSQLVWKEYEIAGLPYNVLSLLRMYQAYLASGSLKAGAKFLRNIPKDDPHVLSVIHACDVTYGKPKAKKKKKKKTMSNS